MLPSQQKLKFTEGDGKRPVGHTPLPRAVKKTSLACAVRTVPAVSLAATGVDNYTDDIFEISQFNSLSTLLRVVAYVKLFIQCICNPDNKGSSAIISPGEMTEAMMILLRQEQQKV